MSIEMRKALEGTMHRLTQQLLPEVRKEKAEKEKLDALMKEHFETEETKELRQLSQDITKQFQSERMILNAYGGKNEIDGLPPEDEKKPE